MIAVEDLILGIAGKSREYHQVEKRSKTHGVSILLQDADSGVVSSPVAAKLVRSFSMETKSTRISILSDYCSSQRRVSAPSRSRSSSTRLDGYSLDCMER